MFAIVLIAIVIAIAVVARMVTVVRNDRPLTPPSSHTNQLDPNSTRLLRIV
jgi:multisubunit Na+/H+ antiporter MnhC subunit